MASQHYGTREDVIEIVTDDFDKVGYTKADEADMARQNKQQQFHRRFNFVTLLAFTAATLATWGSFSHRQQYGNVQRWPSHTDLWIRLLLDRRTDNSSLLGRNGFDGSNIRRPVSLGLYACAT